MNSNLTWFLGLFFHTPQMGSLEVLNNALIGVEANGRISRIIQQNDPDYANTLLAAQNSPEFFKLGQNQVVIPGLVDLHVHAPQWPQLGKALHLPLQNWLQEHTFPLEARYQDFGYAQRVYPSLVRGLMVNGTTTAMYFATIHEAATELLAKTCVELGQRAYVGRVAMDDPNQCPDYYRDESAQSAIDASARSIQQIRQLAGNEHQLVKPVVTPRFIPSCTSELLEGLGELAQRHACHVQTHCSESDWEHQFVIDRLHKTDTQALLDFGLLNRHTVLAHSNFITDNDMSLIHEHGSGIAHCPLSNSYFADSVFPLRKALKKSLRVGLGTDIAGGHSASMFSSCQHAVGSSRMLESGVDTLLTSPERGVSDSRINFMEAFYLATVGGADVLNSSTGCFEVGKQFDALVLQLDHPKNPLNEFTDNENWEDLFSNIVYNTQSINIDQVWVDGVERDVNNRN